MKKNPDFVLKEVLDSYILIDIKSNFKGVIKLNKTSKDIYELLCENKEIDEIKKILMSKYDVSEDEVTNDLLATINSFKECHVFYD